MDIIGLVVSLLVIVILGLVFWLVIWLVDWIAVPEPFNKLIKAVIGIAIVALYLLDILLNVIQGYAPHPVFFRR